MKNINTIVIGGGLMGSAAAWQLSKAGVNVLLLEQQPQEYNSGSSFGISRISRSIGPKDDIFSYLHNQSVKETLSLIEYLNIQSDKQHSIRDIYTKSPVSYLFRAGELDFLNQLCHPEQQDAYKVSVYDNLHPEMKLNLPSHTSILREFTEYAGIINPKEIISKLHQGVIHKGNTIAFNRKVKEIKKIQEGYEVVVSTNDNVEIYFAKNIITAVGPYTPELLQSIVPHLAEAIKPKRVFCTYFKIKNEVYKTLTDLDKERIHDAFPVFAQYDEEFYAMVDRFEDGNPIFKSGAHAIYHDIDNMDATWTKQPYKEYIDWNKEQMLAYLKMQGVEISVDDLEYISGQSCVYSLTSSKIPIVSSISKQNDFVIMAGMNGVGAKGSLCYGLIAADILLGITRSDYMYNLTRKSLASFS